MTTSNAYNDETSYYPSAKVRLIVRFDELARVVAKSSNTPVVTSPTKKLVGVKDKRAPLQVQEDPDAPEGVRRFILAGGPVKSFLMKGLGPERTLNNGVASQAIRVGNADTKKLEHIVAGKSEDGLTQVLAGIVPKDVSWTQNGIRTADTCSITLRFIDCPIDPRTIRSCAVEFFLGTVTPDEYKAGVEGATREFQLYKGTTYAEPMHVVPDTYVDKYGQTRTNRRFIGWVDTWSIDWGDTDPLIHLECRDNTQLVIDQEAPAKLVIGANMPIDEAVVTYLSHFPQFAGLSVEYRPQGEKVPLLKSALSASSHKPTLGPPPSLALGANSGLSVWDYLTDVCGALGLMVRVEDTTIIIQRTRTIYSDENTASQDDKNATETDGENTTPTYSPHPVQRANDPFKPRLPNSKFRTFLFGENVQDLKLSRAFVRNAPTNIEVRCWSTKQKKVLVGYYPSATTGKGVLSGTPGDGGLEEKWKVWQVSGVEDVDTLRYIAQTVYEQLGRCELNVRLKTRNLASLGGGNSDPDLLDMRAGDSFELLVKRTEGTEVGSTLTKIDTALVAMDQGAQMMRMLGFDADFANAYARTYSDLGLQSVFKCRTIGTRWGEDGVTLEIEGINYIEIRADKHEKTFLSKAERAQ